MEMNQEFETQNFERTSPDLIKSHMQQDSKLEAKDEDEKAMKKSDDDNQSVPSTRASEFLQMHSTKPEAHQEEVK